MVAVVTTFEPLICRLCGAWAFVSKLNLGAAAGTPSGGDVVCRIAGSFKSAARPCPINAVVRGALKRISRRALASNLPAHIPERMAKRALATLADFGVTLNIEPQTVAATCAGAGIFLLAEYQPLSAGFSAYGRLGKSSEAVADEATQSYGIITTRALRSSCTLRINCCYLLPLPMDRRCSLCRRQPGISGPMPGPLANLASQTSTSRKTILARFISSRKGRCSRAIDLPSNAAAIPIFNSLRVTSRLNIPR